MLLIAAFLVLLNGFFVAAEFALVKVRSTRIEELARHGSGAAAMARTAVRHLDAYLSATQLGITIASIGLGWVAEPAFHHLLTPLMGMVGITSPRVQSGVAFAVAFLIVTFLHIVFGELAPKSLAIQRSEGVTLWVAYPLHFFYVLFYPAIVFLNGTANRILRLFRIEPVSEHEMSHSEEELRMILTASGQSGVLKDSEVDLVKHVFEFADKRARDIMVPRVDMVYMSTDWSFERNLEVATSHTYSRFPLCEGDPDHVIGMIHVRDLLPLSNRGGGDLRAIAREILSVPETKPIDQLLREFQYRKMHMAVVLDEYGGTSGMVTLEDVVEEIVGDIYDEFEEPETDVQPLPDHQYLVDGKVLISDLKADYEIDIPPNGADTVAGYVVGKLGTIPSPGAAIEVGRFRLEVKQMDGQRVRKVLLTAPPAPVEDGDRDEH